MANVLGVKIDDITMEEAVERVKHYLLTEPKGKVLQAKRAGFYIVTPNPEFLVAAQNDKVFKSILKMADLSIPDGVGLKLTGKVKNTVYGIDLMEELIALSADYGFTIGLLGGKDGVAKKTSECLLRNYPKLKISYVSSGGSVDKDGNPEEVYSMKYKVYRENKENKTSLHTPYSIPHTDLLFVAFGHGKQEKWIANNLKKIPVKVAMGVGGAFDYISGEIPRAPRIIRSLGFEWLFRLILQPWRIKRQLALLKYLLLIWI